MNRFELTAQVNKNIDAIIRIYDRRIEQRDESIARLSRKLAERPVPPILDPESFRRRIDELEQENADLKEDLKVRDRRVEGLREELRDLRWG